MNVEIFSIGCETLEGQNILEKMKQKMIFLCWKALIFEFLWSNRLLLVNEFSHLFAFST